MDWNSLLSVALIVVFILLMMRGCGGMMGGGMCGMPRRRPRNREKTDTDRSDTHRAA